MPSTEARTRYAPVDDLNMYYEIHGRGRPLILLHGAYMAIDMLGPLLRGLAETRQVIAVEQQGHGHTADVDRPITYERMADDTAALARHLELDNAAPNPGDFPKLVEKLKQLDTSDFAWPEEDIRAIAAPTLIILGDSDGIRLEHAIELFGLRGGGVMGDLAGLPESQLAVLPGTSHFVPPGFGLLDRTEWLLAMIPPFLDTPTQEDS